MPGNYGYEFERLIGDIFASNGWHIELSADQRQTVTSSFAKMDIMAAREDVVQPIEAKLMRRENVPLSRLRDDGALTAALRHYGKNAKPLLVYGSHVAPARREWAQSEFDIEIWDIEILRERAGNMRQRLEALLSDVRSTTWPSAVSTAQPTLPTTDDTTPISPIFTLNFSVDPEVKPPPRIVGEDLITALAGVKSGKGHAQAFERVCREIIEYLFGDDLRDGRSQRRTDDDLNIYDLIYRVRPKHPFWVTLTRDFRARVVLFECKNYGETIGAMQVFTTERYLSASALRPICFVLTRKGAHPHAVQAAFGAMRESGKLLVFLSDNDLVQMLRAKDAQLKDGGSDQEMAANDPTELLDQKIYDFISTMPR